MTDEQRSQTGWIGVPKCEVIFARALSDKTEGLGKCCYTNPGYTGVCVVEPAEGETCASVLSYLNTQNSVGKSYCGNTKVRGGWKQPPCKEESRSP